MKEERNAKEVRKGRKNEGKKREGRKNIEIV